MESLKASLHKNSASSGDGVKHSSMTGHEMLDDLIQDDNARMFEQHIDSVWRVYSEDGEKKVDIEDVCRVERNMGWDAQHSMTQARQFMAEVDLNGDGFVDRVEFSMWIRKQLGVEVVTLEDVEMLQTRMKPSDLQNPAAEQWYVSARVLAKRFAKAGHEDIECLLLQFGIDPEETTELCKTYQMQVVGVGQGQGRGPQAQARGQADSAVGKVLEKDFVDWLQSASLDGQRIATQDAEYLNYLAANLC